MTKPPQTPKPDNKPELFVDNEPYDWKKDKITGAQIRTLASLPDDVQIFQKVPGQPDVEIKDTTVVDLSRTKGPDRFYSQAVGSQAGGGDD